MLKMFMKNKKGFTLVELMVVVVIIGILVAIAVPVYNSATTTASRNAVEANLRTIDSAIMQWSTSNTGSPTSAQLTGTYIKTWPNGPTGVTSYNVVSGAAVVTIPANTFGTHGALTNADLATVQAAW